jgi:hypothetical protein
LALPDLMDLIRHDPRRSLVIRAVAGEPGGALPDVEAMWRKALFTVYAGGVAQSGKFSLEDVLDRNRAMMLVDDGAGGQPVDIIFPSLVIVTTEPLPGGAAFAKFLRDRVTQTFSDAMEDGRGFDVRLMVSQAAEHPISVYLGYGVHAPAEGQTTPRGVVSVLAADGAIIGEPEFGDGVAGGVYGGQRMLAFSRSETMSPVTHPDLPAGVVFALGHPPGAGAKGLASSLPPLAVYALSGDPDAASIEVQPAALPSGSKADIRYDITGVKAQRGRVKLCSIDLTLDNRPSRLMAQQPPGLCLKLAGFAIREQFGGRKALRYWIDRTAGGAFRHSAMLAERDSVVVQGRNPRVYRRDELRYERKSAEVFTVDRISFEGDRRSVITFDTGFGFLAMPPSTRTAVAGPSDGGESGWAVNWCGEGITVQLNNGQTARLDSLYDITPLGVVGSNAQGFETHGGADLWVLDAGKAKPAGQVTWPVGTRLVIGPLVVDVTGGE